jgi:hypothetical protein
LKRDNLYRKPNAGCCNTEQKNHCKRNKFKVQISWRNSDLCVTLQRSGRQHIIPPKEWAQNNPSDITIPSSNRIPTNVRIKPLSPWYSYFPDLQFLEKYKS